MHVLVIGAAGMIGRKLTAAIARGGLPVSRLTLSDIVDPPVPAGLPVRKIVLPFTDRQAPQLLLADRPEIIFHLAAVVSAEAEADFDKGAFRWKKSPSCWACGMTAAAPAARSSALPKPTSTT